MSAFYLFDHELKRCDRQPASLQLPKLFPLFLHTDKIRGLYNVKHSDIHSEDWELNLLCMPLIADFRMGRSLVVSPSGPSHGATSSRSIHLGPRPFPTFMDPLDCAFASKNIRRRALTIRPLSSTNPSKGVEQVPHSPSHYDGSTSGRAFEGWYLRLTLPDNSSVAFIHCIEDPKGDDAFSKVTSQVLWGGGRWGKGGYLMQHSRDVDVFWASKDSMEFCATYIPSPSASSEDKVSHIIPEEDKFFKLVDAGFQASETLHHGSLKATQPTGDMLNIPSIHPPAEFPEQKAGTISWAYSMAPLYGWGGPVVKKPLAAAAGNPDAQSNIKSPEDNGARPTTGILASIPLFDPQWQICTAHAKASGWIALDGHRIEFTDAVAYVEKNWGAGFPSKWFWLQCNLFRDHPDLTVTAVGARRRAIQPAGRFVNIGLLGVHFNNGEFIECVPWKGSMRWNVEPWGSWHALATAGRYTIEIDCHTNCTPTWLLGPHKDLGFVPYCRDGFEGSMRIRIWRQKAFFSVIWNMVRSLFASATFECVADTHDTENLQTSDKGELVVDATSDAPALECGGGPWQHTWSVDSSPFNLMLAMIARPIDLD